MSSAGGAQFRVALRMYTTLSCHPEMTVWDKHLGRPHQPIPWVIVSWSRVADMPRRQATPAGSCGGIPSICSLSASPAVHLLATTGTGCSATTDSTRAPPLRHREDQSEARVLLGTTPNRPVRRAELARPDLEALR